MIEQVKCGMYGAKNGSNRKTRQGKRAAYESEADRPQKDIG